MLRHWQSANHSNTVVGLFSTVLISTVLGFQGRDSGDYSRPEKPLSVCQLLSSASKHNNRLVAVRGIYWSVLRQECKHASKDRGNDWPTAINLLGTDLADKTSVNFVTDWKSWDDLDRVVISTAKRGKRDEIWFTVVGLFRVAPREVIDRKPIGAGYGHLGVFPAEIIVSKIVDIHLSGTPTYDYSKMKERHQ